MFTRDQTMPPMVDMPFPSHENRVTIEDILNSCSLPASNEAGMSNHESHFIKNCFGDNSSLGSGLCHEPPQSIQQSAPSAGDLLHRGFENGPKPLMKESIIEDSGSESPARTEEDWTSETAYRICRLNMLLSRQSSLLSRRQQGINIVGVTRTEDNHDAAQLPSETGKVLQYMSDFLSIIQECGQAKVTFGASENTEGQNYHHNLISWALPSRFSDSYPDASNLPSSSLNITGILVLLSCHLQLISIVDVLFQNLHATMSSIPGTSVASVQPIPGLRLAGLPIDHAGLQLNIGDQASARDDRDGTGASK